MGKRWKSRAWVLGLFAILVVTAAAGAKPAKPAVPARPVAQGEEKPLAGRVILVDPGHGGTDGGARAQDSGRWEKEINLQIAKALAQKLENSGARVILTRREDSQFSEKKRADLTARLNLAQQGGAEMLICVHCNEYRSRKESGPQVFYRAGQEQSRLLAGALQEALIRQLQPRKQRAAMAGDYFMLSLDIPSALVECGFLSNPEEERLLLTPDYQARTAQAIHDGIVTFWALTDAVEVGI